MARSNRERIPRVNFFDGQRVTESDLDSEQIHHRGLTSTLITDFHASGIVRDGIFEAKTLLDTSKPGIHAPEGSENLSKYDLEAGNYDGSPMSVDRQPTDTVHGNRLEVQASGVGPGGRLPTAVMIIGTTYSSLNDSGDLTIEILKFKNDDTLLSRHYYKKVIAIIFNNFSGGKGSSYYNSSVENLDVRSSGAKVIIREAEPFKAFSQTLSVYQNESPNVYINSFISSSESRTIEQEVKKALGTLYSFNDIYWEQGSKSKVKFLKDGDQTTAYGQKFLAKSNNIQKISLLLSVEKDTSASAGSEYDFSGDIVISLHKLSSEVRCITDPDPNNLIDFDPELSPIIEMSYSQLDLESLGYKLGKSSRVVDFDFSETLVADPNIEPSISANDYYAILVTRRGDNRTGTVILEKGYDKRDRKTDNGQDLTVQEQFGKRTTRYIEYDSANKVYVDDPSSSLWFEVHTDTVEVTDGAAYTEDGLLVSLPKVEEYVGDSKISSFKRDIPLKTVSECVTNLLVLNREDDFVSPGTHPRTGNFVYTRIEDSPSISFMTLDEWASVDQENPPILLAKTADNNVRDAQEITGIFDKPGYIFADKIIFMNPSSELLNSNLINRIITPDTNCQCNSRYRIIDVKCSVEKAGDLDSDGEITSNDILELLNVVGNTINTETTERKILGGELDILDFIKSDLNSDNTVDGMDIEILEDALDGYINFTAEEEFKVLTIYLENILEEDDYPFIFKDNGNSGSSLAGTDTVTLTTLTDNEALAIRIGDHVTIPSGCRDAGTYIIYSKTVGSTGLDVTLSVTAADGTSVSFAGSGQFNVSVKSSTRVNTFADNLSLLDVPYANKNWKISYVSASHEQRFLETCDLRRYVETNFIEEYKESCICVETDCETEEDCAPVYKNQKVLPNDLFIPSGEIYREPGIPYHGDIEYTNVSIPLPPGSIEDCEIDLYNNFIKAHSGTCLTSSGYPAMKFSDGTYVGCEDSSAGTDLTKNRVKISQAIASLYVDSLIDGYATDGYADETETFNVKEMISENFVNYSYTSFESPWTKSVLGTGFSATTPVGPNQPAVFEMTTLSTTSDRYARINYPSSINDLKDDFIIDFTASREVWQTNIITFREIAWFSTLNITNADGSSAELKVGWKEQAGVGLNIFYSGKIKNALNVVISDFEYTTKSPDHVGDKVSFRLRRTNEAVFAFYHDPTSIDPTENPSGQLIRIGGTPSIHPGSGDAEINFEIMQGHSPHPDVGRTYGVKLHDLSLNYSYSSTDSSSATSINIGRDSNNLQMDRATLTFPFNLNQRTSIVSAEMSFVAANTISSNDSFNIIPLDIINADNIGKIIDYPVAKDVSYMSTFAPGSVAAGSKFTVDVTPMAIYFLSRTGHLPGFYKAVMIEPSTSASTTFAVTSDIDFKISYEDTTTGVIFKIGASLDAKTGIVSLKTKNVLYDSLNSENRTVLNFGVYLKKSGFKNNDLEVSIKDLKRIGVGTCVEEVGFVEDEYASL